MNNRTGSKFISSDEYQATLVRTDDNQENIITHSLELQSRFNSTCAVEYLKSYGIQGSLIEEILLSPG